MSPSTTTDTSPELRAALSRILAMMSPSRSPRWRYFEHRPTRTMFYWTVEKYDDDAPHEYAGLYVSGVYEPYGAGARTGKATRWRVAANSESGHRLRRDAKARALKLYRALDAGERRPWL